MLKSGATHLPSAQEPSFIHVVQSGPFVQMHLGTPLGTRLSPSSFGKTQIFFTPIHRSQHGRFDSGRSQGADCRQIGASVRCMRCRTMKHHV